MEQSGGQPPAVDVRPLARNSTLRAGLIFLFWLVAMAALDVLFYLKDATFDCPIGARSFYIAPFAYGPIVTYICGVALLWNLKGSTGFKVALAIIFGLLAAGATAGFGFLWLLCHMCP